MNGPDDDDDDDDDDDIDLDPEGDDDILDDEEDDIDEDDDLDVEVLDLLALDQDELRALLSEEPDRPPHPGLEDVHERFKDDPGFYCDAEDDGDG